MTDLQPVKVVPGTSVRTTIVVVYLEDHVASVHAQKPSKSVLQPVFACILKEAVQNKQFFNNI